MTGGKCSITELPPNLIFYLIQAPKLPRENDIAGLLDRVIGQARGKEGTRPGQATLLQAVEQTVSPKILSSKSKAEACDVIVFSLWGWG